MRGWFSPNDYSAMLTAAALYSEGYQYGTYGPTLQLRGHSKLEIANPTAADLFAEIIEFTVNESYPYTLTNFGTAFSAAWSYSLSHRESGFEFFPTTSLRQNWVFWTQKYSGIVSRKTRRIRIKPSQVRRVVFHQRPIVVGYADGRLMRGNSNLAFKSTFYAIRTRFATGIVCGSTDWPGPDPPAPSGGILPLISPVGGDVATKVTNYYSYTWVPGNNSTYQTGSWLANVAGTYPGDEHISNTASGWAPDPSQRRMALTGTANVAASGVVNNFTDWGPYYHGPPGFTYAYNPATSRAVGLAGNVPWDCAGDAQQTTVHVA